VNGDEVRALVSPADLVPAMERALAAFSAGEVLQPFRTNLHIGPERNIVHVMPAYLEGLPALGQKVVSVFHGNAARGLPSHFATVLLFDPETGALLALIEGAAVTVARTAAVSAVAAKHLGKSGASRLALFGAGVQARGHLSAFVDVLPGLDDVRVWSPAPDRDQFVAEMSERCPVPVRAAASAADAARGADLIVLVTSSNEPVLQSEWVGSGALVVSVGACRPDWREMDPVLVTRSRLFVDSRVSALAESGDIMQGLRAGLFTEDHIVGELGDVVARRVEGRRDDHETIVFKSLGLAVEDVTAADLIYRRAIERGVGRILDF
jgi:ornithine cyclodeaminase/alanine dehydrogenase-like protein (mu-crystallin family)